MGAIVTVAGDELSLEDAIEAASEAVKQMKSALAKGITAKSAMAYWKDVAAGRLILAASASAGSSVRPFLRAAELVSAERRRYAPTGDHHEDPRARAGLRVWLRLSHDHPAVVSTT